MNIFFTPKEQEISHIKTKNKAKIWHKCSEHTHYIGLPEKPPLLEGEILKKGNIFKKQLFLRVYSDKMIFFEV